MLTVFLKAGSREEVDDMEKFDFLKFFYFTVCGLEIEYNIASLETPKDD